MQAPSDHTHAGVSANLGSQLWPMCACVQCTQPASVSHKSLRARSLLVQVEHAVLRSKVCQRGHRLVSARNHLLRRQGWLGLAPLRANRPAHGVHTRTVRAGSGVAGLQRAAQLGGCNQGSGSGWE